MKIDCHKALENYLNIFKQYVHLEKWKFGMVYATSLI